MVAHRRVVAAAAGTALAVAGGVWGAMGPAQAMQAGAVVWTSRLALVAGIAAVVGAALVLRDHVEAGGGLALLAGVVLIGTGQPGGGITAVLGGTLVLGVGERPEPAQVREALRGAVP